jgi:tetratricopeptide (TPR) repeat protein
MALGGAVAQTRAPATSTLEASKLEQQARSLLARGDLAGAEAAYTQLSRQSGEYGLAGVDGLYTVAEQRGKELEGMEAFRKHYQRTGNLEALALGAARLAESGLTEAASRELAPLMARINKNEPLSPRITRYVAFASRRVGDLDNAVKAAKASEEGFHSLRQLDWISMGDFVAQTLEDMGRTLEALNEYEYLNHESPDNPLILNNFAYHLAVHNKELDRALSMVRRSLALDPGNGHSLDTEGFILIKLNRTEEAIKAMVGSWRRVPDEMVVRTHLAQALAKRKDRSKTMQDLLDVLRTEPDQENTDKIDQLLNAMGL